MICVTKDKHGNFVASVWSHPNGDYEGITGRPSPVREDAIASCKLFAQMKAAELDREIETLTYARDFFANRGVEEIYEENKG